MATSVDTHSPAPQPHQDSPKASPSSDKLFWSNLRGRIDSILEERNNRVSDPSSSLTQENLRKQERSKRLKEDSLLLLRGFDSVSHTLSLLSNNLDNALQGARDLANPPTFTEILQTQLGRKSEGKENLQDEKKKGGQKRKFESDESSDEKDPTPQDKKLTKKAKNLAISMATKAASLARELKSLKSDLCFMQERCTLLEEENSRLRDGFDKGIRPEEDDLVRLQLEALLAEKSRLANENANLVRENQCLHQLVEYHQMTSDDLSASYEEVIRGMCLDFSSPIAEEEEPDEESLLTPKKSILGLSSSLSHSFQEEQ